MSPQLDHRQVTHTPCDRTQVRRICQAVRSFFNFAVKRRQAPDAPSHEVVARELRMILREHAHRNHDTPRNETDVAILQRGIAWAVSHAYGIDTYQEIDG